MDPLQRRKGPKAGTLTVYLTATSTAPGSHTWGPPYDQDTVGRGDSSIPGALLEKHPPHPTVRSVVTRLAACDDIGRACFTALARASSQGGAEEGEETKGRRLVKEGGG